MSCVDLLVSCVDLPVSCVDLPVLCEGLTCDFVWGLTVYCRVNLPERRVILPACVCVRDSQGRFQSGLRCSQVGQVNLLHITYLSSRLLFSVSNRGVAREREVHKRT